VRSTTKFILLMTVLSIAPAVARAQASDQRCTYTVLRGADTGNVLGFSVYCKQTGTTVYVQNMASLVAACNVACAHVKPPITTSKEKSSSVKTK